MFADDHFDVFGPEDDQHGSTEDYWSAYDSVIADAFAITADADEVPFLLTDAELDALDADVDTYQDDSGIDLPEWFAPADAERPF